MVSVPSLAVLLAKTVSKFNPPSVDNLMFTFAEPAKAVVLATFQVIVCELPCIQLIPVVF